MHRGILQPVKMSFSVKKKLLNLNLRTVVRLLNVLVSGRKIKLAEVLMLLSQNVNVLRKKNVKRMSVVNVSTKNP